MAASADDVSAVAVAADDMSGLSSTVVGDAGPAVVWLHGYTLDSTTWGELWSLLPGRIHVGVDLPGHGRTPWPGPPGGLGGLAETVLGVIERHAARHVVAMSFGGLVAIEVGIRARGRLDTLALCSPSRGGGPDDPAAAERNRAIARLHAERGGGPWLTDLWMRSPPDIFTGAARHPELHAALRATVERHAWEELGDGGLREYAATPQPAGRLRAIRARTLLVLGEDDMPAFLRGAELIRRAIPGAKRSYVAGAGHLPALEDPPAVARLLDGLWRLGPPTAGAKRQTRPPAEQ